MSLPIPYLAAVTGMSRRASQVSVWIAAGTLASGMTLAGILVLGTPLPGMASIPLAIALAVVSLAPAVLLIVFAAGLRRLSRLPDALAASLAVDTEAPELPAVLPASRGLGLVWRLTRFLFGLRGALLESKAILLEAGLWIRVLHPAMLLAVLASLAAAAVLAPLAGLAVLLLLLL